MMTMTKFSTKNISSPLKPNGNYIGSDKGSDISASAFDLSTISAVQATESVASKDVRPQSISFNDDGSKIYMVGEDNVSVTEYNLSTNFDISTVSSVQVIESVASFISVNIPRSKTYMVGGKNDSIYEYSLSKEMLFQTFKVGTTSYLQPIHGDLVAEV